MNELTIENITYINLADHPITIKSGDDIIEFGANEGNKPILISEYLPIEGEAIVTSRQNATAIKYLPKEIEGIKLIVPLFIVTGYAELVAKGLRKPRYDLLSPGKKIFGEGGKVLYADGLRCGY